MMKARLSAAAALALAACAHPPGGATKATETAASPSSASAPRAGGPGVHAVAFTGSVAYAWMDGGRLDVWNGSDAKAHPHGVEHLAALAADGSVAVTKTKVGERATRLDVWALGSDSNTIAFTRTFPNGVERVLGAANGAVALLARFPPDRDPNVAMQQVLPPTSYGALWKLARNTAAQQYGIESCREGFAISADAQRYACASGQGGIMWTDVQRNRTALTDLAPEWDAPPTPAGAAVEGNLTGRGRAVYVFPDYAILSIRLGADGNDVYVTYRGTGAHKGWRLERWPAASSLRSGPSTNMGSITRLAATEEDRGTRVLAVSRDGHLLVLGGNETTTELRRAPRYQPERLGTDAASPTAAALSPDGERLVTGHADGSLRLWELRTGRLLATASP